MFFLLLFYSINLICVSISIIIYLNKKKYMTRDKAQVKYLAGNKRMRFFATIINIKKLNIFF